MKKIIWISVWVVMSMGANAQEWNKGDWFLGAQSTGLKLQHRFYDGSSGTDFDVNAVGGWFFADKFSADAMLGFDYAKVTNVVPGFDDSKETNVNVNHAFNFGAGVRYYPVGNLFARVGYNGQLNRTGNLFSYLDVKVGYDLFLSERVFFEPAVYYEKELGYSKENILGLSIGIGVKF